MFCQVWNWPHTWGKATKNGMQCSTTLPIIPIQACYEYKVKSEIQSLLENLMKNIFLLIYFTVKSKLTELFQLFP